MCAEGLGIMSWAFGHPIGKHLNKTGKELFSECLEYRGPEDTGLGASLVKGLPFKCEDLGSSPEPM